jgi:hypothetical protein
MKLFGSEVSVFAKAFVILVAVFIIASGMCGLQWVIVAHSQGDGTFLIGLGVIELAAMALSAIGIVAVLLLWIASAIYKRIASPEADDPKSLFESPDDSNHNEK